LTCWQKLLHASRSTPAQIALAWLLAQKPWIVPIPARLEENTGAASVVLTSEDLKDIEAAVTSVPVQGARYSADRQNLLADERRMLCFTTHKKDLSSTKSSSSTLDCSCRRSHAALAQAPSAAERSCRSSAAV
jgi:hypothetical protein